MIALARGQLELELLRASKLRADLAKFLAGRSRKATAAGGKRLPRSTKLVRSYSKVVKIELVGEEMTYDLEVAGPYHNFVADGFIVHNSVNEYSGRYSLMPMLFYTPQRGAAADAEQVEQSRPQRHARLRRAVSSHRRALERNPPVSRGAYE